ncbi:MAG: HAD family phosphatase [Planctomycetes bacterium]|nr:HAD family phosphatase [Planctomycetota bacterium]
MSPIEAIIFDMDGVLVDSEPLHLDAANLVLAREGHRLSEADNAPYLGWNEKSYWADLVQKFGLARPAGDYVRERHEALVDLLSREMPTNPGVVAFVQALHRSGRPLAVASSSERSLIDRVLEGTGLGPCFSAIASGDEVIRSKPDPEIFRLAAERLACSPGRCLVIEDSVNGIRAAQAAGMRVVRNVTEMTRNLDFPLVDEEIGGFLDLDPEALIARIETNEAIRRPE